ncbi:Modifier of rudimentary Modr [Penicillium lagena]|uniref:Modifier of rudimentary Modr n=1 Tax=Penicillium lagena TaxID=94218 RepID=UPI002540B0CB|nr:Modifier of rudimentary Modr [Penicillium lagena]KAJ5610855.1 Modifier of rudimentary Modr [Penicillium lagena]
MSQSPSPYYSNPQIMNTVVNPDTPPPPPPKPSSHEASRGGTPQNQSSLAAAPQSQAGYYTETQPGGAPPASYAVPTLPEPPTVGEGWLPEIIKDKSTFDLQTILKDPNLISALSSLHPSSTSRQQNLESLIAVNKDLATRVLEMQNHLADLRASTETMLLTHQSLEVSWRKKQTEMDAALAPWSPKALYQRLSAAIAEQEAVCRAVEESFLDEDHQGRASEKEIADWVRRVRAEAAKLAARKEAKARWDEGRVGGWR